MMPFLEGLDPAVMPTTPGRRVLHRCDIVVRGALGRVGCQMRGVELADRVASLPSGRVELVCLEQFLAVWIIGVEARELAIAERLGLEAPVRKDRVVGAHPPHGELAARRFSARLAPYEQADPDLFELLFNCQDRSGADHLV